MDMSRGGTQEARAIACIISLSSSTDKYPCVHPRRRYTLEKKRKVGNTRKKASLVLSAL